MVFLYLLGLAVGVAILVRSADWFTDAAVEVARSLRIPEIIVGATIVSLGTTLPEFAVSFTAAVAGEVDITVGNALGSCICNIGLILGFCTIVSPIPAARAGFLTNGLGALGLTIAFGVLGYVFPNGSRWVGVVMVAGLITYIAATVRTSLRYRAGDLSDQTIVEPTMTTPGIVAWFIFGAVGVTLGSQLMVRSAVALAEMLGIPDLVIGLTVVALGTSTPELAISITGIIKGQRALSVGNIIGANILNLSWVIGLSSLVTELPVQRQSLLFDLPVVAVLTVLLLWFGSTGDKIRRREGALLFGVYLGYLIITFAYFGADAAMT